MAIQDHERILCPSSKAQEGARLFAVRQEDGTMAILPQPLQINADFIREANSSSSAEQRFRFTNKCVESGCAQWTGSRCGVADKVLSVLEDLPVKDELPECGIRPQCRWFRQSGPDTCRVCPFVITHTTEEDWEAQSLQDMIQSR
jgi:hypothetical protein